MVLDGIVAKRSNAGRHSNFSKQLAATFRIVFEIREVGFSEKFLTFIIEFDGVPLH